MFSRFDRNFGFPCSVNSKFIVGTCSVKVLADLQRRGGRGLQALHSTLKRGFSRTTKCLTDRKGFKFGQLLLTRFLVALKLNGRGPKKLEKCVLWTLTYQFREPHLKIYLSTIMWRISYQCEKFLVLLLTF